MARVRSKFIDNNTILGKNLSPEALDPNSVFQSASKELATSIQQQDVFVLTSGQIADGYIDVSFPIFEPETVMLYAEGMPGFSRQVSVDSTGGVGGNGRVTLIGDLAVGGVAALEEGEVVLIKYYYVANTDINFPEFFGGDNFEGDPDELVGGAGFDETPDETIEGGPF